MLKLKKNRNIYVTNGSVFILTLVTLYLPLAAFISTFLPESFYTFSNSHRASLKYVYYSFPIIILFFYTALTWNKWLFRQDVATKLFKQSSRICFYLCIVQWSALILTGLYGRVILGLDRGALLSLEHSFLVSGTSLIYILAFIYAARTLRLRGLIIIASIFLAIDFIYMGKKFIFYLIALVLFHVDSRAYVKSVKPVYIAFLGGGIFVITIFLTRALVAGSPLTLGLYSIFSEFIGVVSTVGFSIEYGQKIDGLWMIVGKLQPFYYDFVGHGLALNPVGYFIIIGGEFWLLALVLYLCVFTMLFYLFSMLIGDLILLIFLMNVVHFCRHGPDIFLFQFVTQALFVTIVMYLGSIKKHIVKEG